MVPSIHAQKQAHGRVVRSLPAGLDQTKPQTLYPIYPQPYGSGLSVNVKAEFWGLTISENKAPSAPSFFIECAETLYG